jgi:hypothetical protein
MELGGFAIFKSCIELQTLICVWLLSPFDATAVLVLCRAKEILFSLVTSIACDMQFAQFKRNTFFPCYKYIACDMQFAQLKRNTFSPCNKYSV